MKLGKKEQNKSKTNRRKEIINIKAKMHKIKIIKKKEC